MPPHDLLPGIVLAAPTCVEGVPYKVAGLGGILAAGVLLWAVSAAGSQVLHLTGRLLQGRRETQGSHVDPMTMAASVTIATEARHRRRRSTLRFLLVLAGLCGVVLLLPTAAVAIGLIIMFPILALLAIQVRDFAALGSGGTAPGRIAAQLGPPLLIVRSERSLVVAFVTFLAMGAVGFGLLLVWVTVGRLACPAEGTVFDRGLPIGTAALVAGVLLLRVARRTATPRSADLLAADARDPVLYLRSFTDDRLRITTARLARRTWLDRLVGPTRERFEAVIAWHLWSYGPVVAIRRPGGSRQPVGAARQELDNAEWTLQIDEWLTRARLIVLTLGRSEGLQWEMDRIRELNCDARLLLLFPPVEEDELARRWLEFQHGWPDFDVTTSLPPVALSAVTRSASSGGATIIVGDQRDEVGYRMAIEAAAGRLGIEPLAWDLMSADDAVPPDRRALPEPRARLDSRSASYYVALRETVKGPYGPIDLRRMAAHRQIDPNTLVITEKGPWVPVGHIVGIYSRRFRSTTIALALLGGLLGLDRFYLGKTGSALAKLLTLAGLGSWWLLDLVLLAARATHDADGLPLR